MDEEEIAYKVKTSKNGEEVDEGCGGGESRLVVVVEGSKRSLIVVHCRGGRRGDDLQS